MKAFGKYFTLAPVVFLITFCFFTALLVFLNHIWPDLLTAPL